MKIGYLMNSYPRVSTTFIGREIAGLEAQGVEVPRFAMRRWDEGALTDPTDIEEAGKTDYILEDGGAALVKGFFAELAQNPGGVAKALKLWIKLLLNARAGPVRHAAYLLEAIALRRRFRKDPVAHLHAHFSTNAAAAAMLCRALGGPSYSFTVHGPDEFFDPESNSLGMKIEHAAFLSCISHFCRSQCMIFAPVEAWDRLRIVHCGVRPAFYAGEGAGRGRGEVLFVGRLSQIKGGPVLLDAFAKARAAHPHATLRIIGDGEQREMLKAKAVDLGIGGAVQFDGYRTQTEVRDAMQAADLLILPSFAEGVPVTLMEAMASGLPVIGSRVAGEAELIDHGENGFLVHAGDVEGYGEAMATLLGDADLRARMGASGRAKVAAEFDLDKETAWLAELLRGAAEGTLPEGLRPGA
ncbi:glycosyltransferase family 4 protein [Rhodovulum sp. DZ06]|uniref:glycosyltransferase family 4 protein n=1 Tax=Rhodovulum sp. DZ06 TaxID=3425126 RepID=UPI003D32BD2F